MYISEPILVGSFFVGKIGNIKRHVITVLLTMSLLLKWFAAEFVNR